MKRLIFASFLAGMAILGGCQSETMDAKQKSTLTESLNKPVDVEKIRAEYAKEHGNKATETGAPKDEQ